jgi:hypothetical protein
MNSECVTEEDNHIEFTKNYAVELNVIPDIVNDQMSTDNESSIIDASV